MENSDQSPDNPVLTANDTPATVPALEGLQFQRAEIIQKACVVCSANIDNEYFQLSGLDLCSTCSAQWRQGQHKPAMGAVGRGVLYGLGAAIAGAVLMAVIAGVTGYQISLVAIALGWMVAKAFRKGTGGLSSRRCQYLALAVTYFGITASEMPQLIMGIKEMTEQRAAKAGDGKSANSEPGSAKTTSVASAEGVGLAGAKAENGKAMRVLTPFTFVLAVAFLLVLSLFSPFLMLLTGFSGIVNAVIVFFGLQRAWQMMAPDRREMVGPLTVGPATASATIGL